MGFRDIRCQTASWSGRTGPGRIGSGRFIVLLGCRHQNKTFFSMHHMSTTNIKDFMLCGRIPYICTCRMSFSMLRSARNNIINLIAEEKKLWLVKWVHMKTLRGLIIDGCRFWFMKFPFHHAPLRFILWMYIYIICNCERSEA